MKIRAFITHKKAEYFSDCQDRFGVNSGTKSIAVSDGMGSTWQQKIWAQILVEEFIKNIDYKPTHENIKSLCSLWRNSVEASIAHLKETNAPQNIIIRNERCLVDGRSAGATFVGIRFDGNDWNGSVLGDSCLIEWDGENAKFFTSQDVEAFDSYPDYFDSDATKDGKGSPKPIDGTLTTGCVLLVSDPFSEFLLEHKTQGDIAEYINQILKLSSHEEFESLVNEWRNAGMHNDDTTLVIVENDEKAEFSISHLDILDKLKEEESRQIRELEETPTILADTTEEKPTFPKEHFSQSEDERDFIDELKRSLDTYLKKLDIGNKKVSRIKQFFGGLICGIIQRYKISKK